SVLAPFLEKGIEDRLAATTRRYEAKIRFVDAPGYFVEFDLRPAFRAIAGRQLLQAHSCVTEQRQCGALVRIVLARHPKHPGGEEQFQAPSLLVLLPEPQSLRGHLCVNPGRSVGRADDACFPA